MSNTTDNPPTSTSTVRRWSAGRRVASPRKIRSRSRHHAFIFTPPLEPRSGPMDEFRVLLCIAKVLASRRKWDDSVAGISRGGGGFGAGRRWVRAGVGGVGAGGGDPQAARSGGVVGDPGGFDGVAVEVVRGRDGGI